MFGTIDQKSNAIQSRSMTKGSAYSNFTPDYTAGEKQIGHEARLCRLDVQRFWGTSCAMLDNASSAVSLAVAPMSSQFSEVVCGETSGWRMERTDCVGAYDGGRVEG